MLKVGDSAAALNEQDCKIGKVSLLAMKNKNGFSNVPVPSLDLASQDKIRNSLDSNATHRTDLEKIKNGMSVDMSVYEYCRKIINSPSSQDVVDDISSPESVAPNHLPSDTSRGLAISDPTISITAKMDSLPCKSVSIIRKKKVKDLPCTSEEQPLVNEKTSILSDPNKIRKPAQTDSAKKNCDSDEKDQLLSLSSLEGGGKTLKNSEAKIFRGQKAKKTLISQSSFKVEDSTHTQKKNADGNDAFPSSKFLSDPTTSEKTSCQSSSSAANAINRASSPSSGGVLTGMTIKVNVLENALGLSTKSFSQLDAKTFDRIVLSVFQTKGIGQARKSGISARASAKFGSTSRHANRRVGSAFMTESLQSPQQSPMLQHQTQQQQYLSSQQQQPCSPLSNNSSVKKSGFLAKKSSLPSLFSSTLKRIDGSASEPMDSDSQSSNLNAQESSTKSIFVQKARKSSQLPWSVCKNSGNRMGKDSDVSTDINCQFNVSDGIAKDGPGKAAFFDESMEKNGECVVETDEKSCMQTRQSYKRKCSALNFLSDESQFSVKRRRSCYEKDEYIDGGQARERRIKTSDFLVPMSRPSTRFYREAGSRLSTKSLVGNEKEDTTCSDSVLSSETRKDLGIVPSCDPARLCCCLLPGVINTMVTKCRALDSFDGKVAGCSRKVANFEMLRPSAKIPFRVFCEEHRRKLKDHQCCPGCGLFCTQGNFFECKEDHRQDVLSKENNNPLNPTVVTMTTTSTSVHRFHKQCQIFAADNKCYCPHCFSESSQLEGVVYNSEQRPATFLVPPGGTKIQDSSNNTGCSRSGSARLCTSRKSSKKNNGSVRSDSLNSIQSSQSEDTRARNSLDFHALLETFNTEGFKLKKVRPCPKSLCLACKTGDTGRVVYILAEGVDPSVTPDDLSQPAIHLASKNGHHDIVDILLNAGVSVDSFDRDLHTPLMEASQNGCLSVVDLLIKAGSSVDARAHDGMTALHLAAKCGRREVIRVLMDTRKIPINTKDDGGWTALTWATEHSHKDCIGFLLSTGANPNIKDNELNTALHWAAYTGNEDVVAMFLDAGCFVDDINHHGDSPLHIAARQDHFKCVEVLLLRSANTTIVNKAGLSPMECCPNDKSKSVQHLKFVSRLPTRQKEKIISRDISRGRESCPIMVVNSVDSEDMPPDFSYILGYVETSPINVNRLVTSLHVCSCVDNCSSSASCSCCRSSIRRWYDENGKLSSDFNFLEPPLIYECNIMCSCKTTCLNRIVQSGTINNLQVFRTDGRGWGCRTLRDIAKGTFVCEYAGELITDEEANRREDDSYLFDLDFQDSETYCIDAARYGNVSRFINHLCEPNVIPVKVFVDHQDLRFPRICFFASEDIKAFDELGFDYGYKFWSIKWKYFTCTCGSKNCKYSKDTILKTIEEYNKVHADETGDE